jgi:hypothetical protein
MRSRMLVPSGLTDVIMQLPGSLGFFAIASIDANRRMCDS